MARTIVIGVEPETGGRLGSIGLELARTLNARLVLVHVGERSGRQVLDGWSAALPPDVDVEKRVEHGGVASKLSDVANEVGAALIVVGAPGRGPVV